MKPLRSERGAAALEWAIVAPLFVLVLGVMAAGWRLSSARSELAHAAEAGARAASLERSSASAAATGRHIAAANLNASACHQPEVTVGTEGFSVPVGQPAAVTVTVACHVPLGDLLLPGVPGSVDLDAAATTPLDRYRSRR